MTKRVKEVRLTQEERIGGDLDGKCEEVEQPRTNTRALQSYKHGGNV